MGATRASLGITDTLLFIGDFAINAREHFDMLVTFYKDEARTQLKDWTPYQDFFAEAAEKPDAPVLFQFLVSAPAPRSSGVLRFEAGTASTSLLQDAGWAGQAGTFDVFGLNANGKLESLGRGRLRYNRATTENFA